MLTVKSKGPCSSSSPLMTQPSRTSSGYAKPFDAQTVPTSPCDVTNFSDFQSYAQRKEEADGENGKGRKTFDERARQKEDTRVEITRRALACTVS